MKEKPNVDRNNFEHHLNNIRESFYFWIFLFKNRKNRLRPRSQAKYYAAFLAIAAIIAAPVAALILIFNTYVSNKYIEALTFSIYIFSFSYTLAQYGDKMRRHKPYNIVAFTKRDSWFSERVRDGVNEIFRERHEFNIKHETIDGSLSIDEQDDQLCNSLLTLSRSKDVDAVIIRPIMDHSAQLETRISELIKQGIFVVLIDVYVDLARFIGDDVDSPCLIYSDDQTGAKQIVNFIELKYSEQQQTVDLLVLAGPLRAAPGRRRSRSIFTNMGLKLPKIGLFITELDSWSEVDGLRAFKQGLDRIADNRRAEAPSPKSTTNRTLICYCGTDMNAYEINRLIEIGELRSALTTAGYEESKVFLIGYNGAKEDDRYRVGKSRHVIATVDARPNMQGKLAASLVIERSETNKKMNRISFPLPPSFVDLNRN